MTTFTEIVAAVVVHSSAAAFSHFGVVMEPVQVEKTQVPVERVGARTPHREPREKVVDCPQSQSAPRAKAVKA